MTNPLSSELVAFGAQFKPAIVAPGQEYWKIIEAIGPREMGGQHHLFIDVLDAAGQRMVGVPVIFYSQNEQWPTPTEAKPGEPSACNLPLFAGGNAYGVRMGDGRPSDDLFGVGLGSYVPHHSFRVVFRLATAADAVPEPAPTPPTPPSGLTARSALQQMRRLVDELERSL